MFKRFRVKLRTPRHLQAEFTAVFLRIFHAVVAEEICTENIATPT